MNIKIVVILLFIISHAQASAFRGCLDIFLSSISVSKKATIIQQIDNRKINSFNAFMKRTDDDNWRKLLYKQIDRIELTRKSPIYDHFHDLFYLALQKENFASWAIQLKLEITERKIAKGISAFDHQGEVEVLVETLKTRMENAGFIFDDDQPFQLDYLGTKDFFSLHEQSKVFVDVTGIYRGEGENIQNGYLGYTIEHGMWGHFFQIAYYLDHSPNFLELYQYIGKTQDADKIWWHFFEKWYGPSEDNSGITSSPGILKLLKKLFPGIR